MKKKKVLQLALQLKFRVAQDNSNSLYLYFMSVNEQIAWITKLKLIVHMVQLVATQLELYQNNSFSTTMQSIIIAPITSC